MRKIVTAAFPASAAALLALASCLNGPKPPPGNWAMTSFTKVDSVNPVLSPGESVFFDSLRGISVSWEKKDVFNPATVVKEGKLFLLYRAQDNIGLPDGTSRIGLAVSEDGYHFTRWPTPVLYPEADGQKQLEWEGGCEDPRVVQDERGVFFMTYTAFDGQTARLLVATSTDLVHWMKQGGAFAGAYNGRYSRSWSKSGSIVSRYSGGKIVATKVNGKYWMYWGDKDIWAATSDDLVHWTPVEMDSTLKIVVAPRSGHWDSQLVESGPPAMITKKGILLIYNGMNRRSDGDSTLPEGMYGGGQVLLDINDPTKILRRLDTNFIHPDKPYEITGQVNQVCFLEGLANFKGHWLLYYGTADSRIAVATGCEEPMDW